MTNFYKLKKEVTNYIIKLYDSNVDEKTIKFNVLTNYGFGDVFVDKILTFLKEENKENE